MTVPEPAAVSRDAPRIAVLDGLRSLVLLVLFYHFTIEAARSWSPAAALPIYLSGIMGVVALDVFFVLSGYLITGILLDTRARPGYFRVFYLRRAVRILPLYYGFLFVYMIGLPALVSWDTSAMQLDVAAQLPYWAYYVNVPYGAHGELAAYTGHVWSLSVEEQFYLVWPLVVWWSGPTRLARVALACLVIAPLCRYALASLQPDTLLFYSLTPARLDGLALGALLAVAWRTPGSFARLVDVLRPAGFLSLVVAMAIVGWSVLQPGGLTVVPAGRATVFLTASAIMAACVVATMLRGGGGMWYRIAASGTARRIGMYSYGIYLLHNPLGHVLSQAGIIPRPMAGAGVVETLGYALVLTAITIMVAAASWHLFERPLLRWRPGYGPAGGEISSKENPASSIPPSTMPTSK